MSDQKDSSAREFVAVLLEVGGGRLHTRLSDQLAEVTAAVKETGKPGVLTLKLAIKPLAKGDGSTLVVTGSSAVKAPEGDDDSPTSVFFADDEGNLSRDDPRQPTLPFRQEIR